MPRGIGFQGERGAYSEQAVLAYDADAEPVPFDRLDEVFDAVQEGRVDAALVPIENSQAGSINRTYDLLRSHELHITAEVVIQVDHCLLALPNQRLSDVASVRSHPQALEQCAAFLDKHALEPVASSDTAGAAREVAEDGDLRVAALASERAAALHGLQVLERRVQTIRDNWTRFVALGREPVSVGEGEHKTSLVFATQHTPGALHEALGHFARRGVNLVKLESRPTREQPWQYLFYADLEGHQDEASVAEALAVLEEQARFVRVFGSYRKRDQPIE